MFCPTCGKPEQTENAYCRGCGEFLPDFETIKKRGFSSKSPAENIKSSIVLSGLSSIVSIVMAILLYATHFGIEGVHPLIYVSAAFFTVIGAWQSINVFTILKLKNQVAKGKTVGSKSYPVEFHSPKTVELLNEPNMDDYAPASVTDRTTQNLIGRDDGKLSKSEH